MMAWRLLPLLAAFSGPAVAQEHDFNVSEVPDAPALAADRPTMDVALPTKAAGCERPVTTDDVVICGRRDDARYRLDSRLVEARRRMEPVRGPSITSAELLASCSNVSARGCPGQGATSVSGAALKLVGVLVAAVRGDDWKVPLRSGEPDEYQVYKSLAPPEDPPTAPAP